MGRIYLVRHGQASLLDDDYDRLSALGEEQAVRVGEWLGARPRAPVLVASGLLRRQVQTLKGCMVGAGWADVETIEDHGFDEYTHTDLFAQGFPDLADYAAMGRHLRASAHPRHEFHAMFEVALNGWLQSGVRTDGGLTWDAFRAR